MKTILLKTELPLRENQKSFIRYRLLIIAKNNLENLLSEKNLSEISREIAHLDDIQLVLELNKLKKSEQKLIMNEFKRIKELNKSEKYRFYKYLKENSKKKVI